MGGMSLFHWLIVIIVVLIVFGPSRLPNLGKSLGQAIRGFKKGLDETTDGLDGEETRKEAPQRLESAERVVKEEVKQSTKEEA
ncbi:MAG: twin-arginine translocase TatA/TatE family subunit [Bdellovibrionales bacterium]|nr:twin-arginine translocase TatA/TatE family subunit [Bdellovibrionales bacterium]